MSRADREGRQGKTHMENATSNVGIEPDQIVHKRHFHGQEVGLEQ